MSPNIRVPLQGLDDLEIDAVTAGIAKAWKQEGVPATRFSTVLPEAEVADGAIRTHSLFIPTTADVDGKHWLRLANALPEANEISIKRSPNGYIIDIHPDYDKGVGLDIQDVEDLVKELKDLAGDLTGDVDIIHRDVAPYSYESMAAADTAINKWKNKVLKDAVKDIKKRTGLNAKDARAFLNGNAGAASALSSRGRSQVERIRDAWQQRISDYDKAASKAQDLAGSLAEAQRDWAEKFGPRLGAPAFV